MPSVKLYIATCLDGYIADRDGGVDWLHEVAPFEAGEDYGYAAFYKSIGSLAMGRKTYEQVLTFGEWPYARKPTYVFSTNPPAREDPKVTFVSDPPKKALPLIFDRQEGDLWLVGGAGLIASFREQGLIDEYIISVMPVLLGEGISLFSGAQPTSSLELLEVRSYKHGVVQLHYRAAR